MKLKIVNDTYYDLEKVKVPEYNGKLTFGIRQKRNGRWIAEDAGGIGIIASGATRKELIETMKKCYSTFFEREKNEI